MAVPIGQRWAGALGQGVLIVASILLAFGIEAWWDDRQEQQHRAALLDDLAVELRQNRDALSSALALQRTRADRIEELLNEVPG